MIITNMTQVIITALFGSQSWCGKEFTRSWNGRNFNEWQPKNVLGETCFLDFHAIDSFGVLTKPRYLTWFYAPMCIAREHYLRKFIRRAFVNLQFCAALCKSLAPRITRFRSLMCPPPIQRVQIKYRPSITRHNRARIRSILRRHRVGWSDWLPDGKFPERVLKINQTRFESVVLKILEITMISISTT